MTDDDFGLVIHGRQVLIEGHFIEAWIGVEQSTIAAVSHVPLAGRKSAELADGDVLIPGIVDTHVHVNDPGRSEWEGFASATRAALAGGVTTLIDMPLNSIPPTISVDALNEKRSVAAGTTLINTGFWGGAVPENLGQLQKLHDAGVFGFKAFLSPSGVPEFGHLNRAQLFAALEEIASFSGVLIVHAEDPGVLNDHQNRGGPSYSKFVDSRPPAAERNAIADIIDGVRATGARAHILHLSSVESIPMLRAARAEGLQITVETCPHYLAFVEEEVPDGATQFKCCPPIRDRANQEALWSALVEGDIDMIVSDHSPSTRELKFAGGGDFGMAWGGIAGIQSSLAAVWTEARERGIGLERVAQWMSSAPARFVGLAAKGSIEVGADADLVSFSPEKEFRLEPADLLYRNTVSAYLGRTLRGVVGSTWIGGVAVSPSDDSDRRGILLCRG